MTNRKHRVDTNGCKITITNLRTAKSVVVKVARKEDVSLLLDVIFETEV